MTEKVELDTTDMSTPAPTGVDTRNVVERIIAAAIEVGFVGKDVTVQAGGGGSFSARGIDAVLRKVSPAMHRHGVIVAPRIIDVAENHVQSRSGTAGYRVTMLVEHTFRGIDGSTVVATTRGEGIDYGDKASNKAMSQALKYAITETLQLPTDEPEPEAEQHDLAPATQSQSEAEAQSAQRYVWTLQADLVARLGGGNDAKIAAREIWQEASGGFEVTSPTFADQVHARAVELIDKTPDPTDVDDDPTLREIADAVES